MALYNPSDFLQFIKLLVTGKNASGNDPQSGSRDGGIKHDNNVPLFDITGAGGTFNITDNSTGTANATGTLTAITTPTSITDNTGGTTTYGGTNVLGTVTTTFVNTQIANNFATLQSELAAVRTELIALQNNSSTIAKAFNAGVQFVGSVSSSSAIVIPSGTNQAIGSFSFIVPRDYDEASDALSIRAYISLANADASITATATATVRPLGGSAVTKTAVNGTAEFLTTALNLTTTEQRVCFDLSGYGLKRGTQVTVALALVGTTTGNTNVYGVEYLIESCIVSYNDTDLTGSDSFFGTTGNPLR